MLASGATVGRYRIEKRLGSGGMGDVYEAVDIQLHRRVALKTLLPEHAGDPDRRDRLLAEARAAAALNHPNICTIYEVGSEDGLDFLAMELMEGITLERKLEGGPLSEKELARIAPPLAAALAEAHGRGVLHRDVKPANIFVLPDGSPKILDFGVAKRIPLEVTGEKTPTVTIASEDGTIRGTISYMSPEQVRGEKLDRRSDLFSFGVVLFEMAAGLRPFEDPSPAVEVARILRDEPPALSSIRPEISPAWSEIVGKLLEKDPADRYQTAADLAVDLRRVDRAVKTSSARTSWLGPKSWRRPQLPRATGARRMAPAAAILLALGLLSGALIARRFAGVPAAPAETARITPVTVDAGVSESPSWAPDGDTIAYSSDRTGNFEIYLRRVSGGKDLNVTNDPADDVQPAFSPDGKTIAFVSNRSTGRPLTRINPDQEPTGGDLWVVPSFGGQARKLASGVAFPTWSPDGGFVYFVGGAERKNVVYRTPAGGGQIEPVLGQDALPGEYRRLSVSSDGRWLVLGVAYQGIWLASLAGGKTSRLDDGARPSFAGPGFDVVWSGSDSNLWRRSVDPAKSAWKGLGTRLTVGPGWDTDAAVDRSGRRVAFVSSRIVCSLVEAPLDSKTGETSGPFRALLPGAAYDMDPSLSPDGREIVFVSVGRWPGPQRAFQASLPEGTFSPLSNEERVSESNPLFSPDGRWIVLERDIGDGKGALWLLPREGGAPRQIATGAEKSVAVWYPDSRRVAFQSAGRGRAQFRVASIEGGPEETILSEPYDTMHPAISPDGTMVAFAGNRDGDFDIFVKPLPVGPARKVAGTPGRDGHPFFSKDNRWLYFQPGHQNIFRVPIEGGTPRQVTHEPTHNFYLDAPNLSPDGRSLVASRCAFSGNVEVLDLSDGAR